MTDLASHGPVTHLSTEELAAGLDPIHRSPSDHGTLELIALNGYYTLMAMVLNNAGLPLPGNVDPPLK